jgi:hypothetical protein
VSVHPARGPGHVAGATPVAVSKLRAGGHRGALNQPGSPSPASTWDTAGPQTLYG